MHGVKGSADACTGLLLRAQRGDGQAFAQLYTGLCPVVGDFAASLDRRLSVHEQEELTQEVFLRVWKNLPGYRAEASARTFILAITRRLLLKELAIRRRRPTLLVGDLRRLAAEDAPGSWLERQETADAVGQAMAKLTPPQRQAVEFDLSRNSRTAAARVAYCSPGQFADRLYQARKRLRQMLKGLLRCVPL
jgi:RNA polymerase sigma-70 factor (ECF subfamily)